MGFWSSLTHCPAFHGRSINWRLYRAFYNSPDIVKICCQPFKEKTCRFINPWFLGFIFFHALLCRCCLRLYVLGGKGRYSLDSWVVRRDCTQILCAFQNPSLVHQPSLGWCGIKSHFDDDASNRWGQTPINILVIPMKIMAMTDIWVGVLRLASIVTSATMDISGLFAKTKRI